MPVRPAKHPDAGRDDAGGRHGRDSGFLQRAGVPAGRHAVTAGVVAHFLTGNKDNFRNAIPVTISDGESLENVNLDFQPGAVISGKITSPAGQPYVGLRPSLFRKEPSGSLTLIRPLISQIGKTDDRGIFRFFGLPPGTYLVSAIAVKQATGIEVNTNQLTTYYPGTTRQEEARPIELREGEERLDIDFELHSDDSETFDVEGRFINALGGEPLANIPFGLVIPSNSPKGSPRTLDNVGTSSSNGAFLIRDLQPGKYRIYFSPRRDARFYAEPMDIEVVDKPLQGLEVKGRPAATISGKLVIEGGPGAIQEYLQSGVSLSLAMTDSSGSGQYRYTWMPPDSDGNFQVGGIEPGKWAIGVSSPSKLQLRKMEIGGVPFTRTIDVEPGKSISGMRIYFALGTGKISGSVRILNGTWPSDVVIGVSAEKILDPNDPAQGARLASWCDARMNISIEGLLPGQYRIYPTFNGTIPSFLGTVRQTVTPEIVTVGTGEAFVTITIDLGGVKK